MASKIVISEKEVLQLLRDFLEETKRSECLVTFERCTGSYPLNLREELVKLRRVCLFGDLDVLQERIFAPFRTLGNDEELRKCKYAIAKQQYLENLVQLSPDNSDMVKKHLVEAERLCPSTEEFKVLLSLLSLQSIDVSAEYKGWTIEKGRLECFYLLASWLSKLLGENSKLTPPESPVLDLSKSRLVQLVAKGLVYEKCEAIYAHSQAEESREQGEILDLYNWIKHQPDSAFQLSPTSMQLSVTTELRESKESPSTGDPSKEEEERSREIVLVTEQSPDSQEQQSSPGSDCGSETEKETINEQAPATGGAENVTSFEARGVTSESVSVDTEDSEGCDKLPAQTQLTDHNIMMKFEDNFLDTSHMDGASHVDGAGHIEDAKSMTANSSSPTNTKSEANLAERIVHREAIASSTSAPALSAQPMEGGLKLDGNVKETPEIRKLKKGRKSSTPKPSSSKQLTQHSSPSTSPVPYVPPSHHYGPGEQRHYSAKKQINFSENDESIVFPTTQLLAQVKDQQVGKVLCIDMLL